ncbi:MAG: hypothetical protein CL927_02825 [Deltaproteobacteria bacterium]|nr:hypothetical protein [Deltaproteobacteria bacterium]HCH62861.1 hypothetical protein [Deltaproteobacteria bacterium]
MVSRPAETDRIATAWDGAILALAGWVIVEGIRVMAMCCPTVPLYDHAVFVVHMLATPPELFLRHNEHIPLVPRLVVGLEVLLSEGEPRIPVSMGLFALCGAAVVASRGWQSRARLVCAAVLFAAMMRPSLAWSASWVTNIQFSLALFGAAVAFQASRARRSGLAIFAGLLAGLSSAEGLLVLPLSGWLLWRAGDRRSCAVALVGWVVLTAVCSWEGALALRVPADARAWWSALAFAASVVADPWSLRLVLAVAAPLLLGAVAFRFRDGHRADRVLLALALYGFGFALLVVLGRWSLGEAHHRYTLGATVGAAALLGGLLHRDDSSRSSASGAAGVRRFLLLGLMGLLSVESFVLGAPTAQTCAQAEPPGTAFWRGETNDSSAAHPGMPAEIAQELRAHVWEAGLYRPRHPPTSRGP